MLARILPRPVALLTSSFSSRIRSRGVLLELNSGVSVFSLPLPLPLQPDSGLLGADSGFLSHSEIIGYDAGFCSPLQIFPFRSPTWTVLPS